MICGLCKCNEAKYELPLTNKYICYSCKEILENTNLFFTCNECNKIRPVNEYNDDSDTCNSCFEEFYVHCDKCDTLFNINNDNCYSEYGENYCEECASLMFIECSECGETKPADELTCICFSSLSGDILSDICTNNYDECMDNGCGFSRQYKTLLCDRCNPF